MVKIAKLLVALIFVMSSFIFFTPTALADDTTMVEFEPNIDINGNATYQVINKYVAAQTFTADSVYEISMIRIYGYVSQNSPAYPFTINVELHNCNGTVVASTVPTKSIAYHTPFGQSAIGMNSYNFTTDGNGSWMDCPLNHSFVTQEGEMYSVYIKVPSGGGNNSFYWYENEGGAQYPTGAACTSSDSGTTWTVNGNDTFMFELWGNSGLLIHDVVAFNSVSEDGDWLIAFSYKNQAPPYYQDNDIEQHFRVTLTDNATGNVSGETVLRFWDAGVGSIYMNPDEVTDIEWEWGNFTLSIVANYGTLFHVDWDLPIGNASTWLGTDLTFLDKWCLAQARWAGLENHNDKNYYIISGGAIGDVLSSDNGIKMFELGIPGLGAIRGDTLYELYVNDVTVPTTTPNPALQNQYVWTSQLGAELSGALGGVATPFHLTGKEMGLIACLAIYVMVVGSSFPIGHGLAGTIAGMFIVGIGMSAGVVDFVWVFMAGAFLLLMALRQLILVGQ